jgi:hypothetical protein
MKIEPNILRPPGFKQDQVKAINFLKDFLNSDKLEATLAGSAGTGKTYLLKYFMDKVCNVSVCPTAPTHKALRVVEKHLNRKGKTLQSLHGLRPNLDIANFDIANPQFDPRGTEYIKNYKLVIIDEASMITDDMYELNLRRAKLYGTKILYVGDPLQLSPIQKNKSNGKVFAVETICYLNEIVRQEEGNPLLELFPIIRNDVLKGSQNLLEYLKVNKENMSDETGYKVLSLKHYQDEVDEFFSLDLLKKDIDAVRVIAYTNEAVYRNNIHIRNKLLGNPKDILDERDILTSYTTIVDEFNYPIIINSEDYYVNTIRPYTDQHGIKTFAVNLMSAFDNRLTQTLKILDHTDAKSFALYYQILNALHGDAKYAHKSERGAKWVKYFKFKEEILTMVSFELNEANDRATVKKDIDYGYAITAHKSQGSTFKNVFIDLRDILFYEKNGRLIDRFDINMMNRLIYVAMSRASNKVIMKL